MCLNNVSYLSLYFFFFFNVPFDNRTLASCPIKPLEPAPFLLSVHIKAAFPQPHLPQAALQLLIIPSAFCKRLISSRSFFSPLQVHKTVLVAAHKGPGGSGLSGSAGSFVLRSEGTGAVSGTVPLFPWNGNGMHPVVLGCRKGLKLNSLQTCSTKRERRIVSSLVQLGTSTLQGLVTPCPSSCRGDVVVTQR